MNEKGDASSVSFFDFSRSPIIYFSVYAFRFPTFPAPQKIFSDRRDFMAEAQSDTYPWSQTEVNIIYWKFRKGRTRLNMEVYIIAFRSVRKPPAPTAVRVRHATFTRAREPDIFTNHEQRARRFRLNRRLSASRRHSRKQARPERRTNGQEGSAGLYSATPKQL